MREKNESNHRWEEDQCSTSQVFPIFQIIGPVLIPEQEVAKVEVQGRH